MKSAKRYILILIAFLYAFVWGNHCYAQCHGTIGFTASNQKGCALLVVLFTATGTSTSAGTTFKWNLGSGFVSGKDTISKAYAVAGKYTITMRATFSNGDTCVVKKDTFITVFSAPTPKIYVSAGATLCDINQPVTFIDSTKGGITREWIIDGQSIPLQRTIFNFKSVGTRQYDFSVSNGTGCKAFLKKTITVFEPVTVDFCANVSAADTGNTVYFFPSIGPIASGRSIAGYFWNLPGASPSTSKLKTPTVFYSDYKSRFDVTLTITMSDGCSYTFTRKGFMSQFMTPNYQTECAGSFFVVSMDQTDADRHQYTYTFPSAAAILFPPIPDPKVFSVKYDKAGDYGATISYRYGFSNCFITVSYKKYITVTGPKAAFTSDDNLVCQTGDTIHFQNMSNEYNAPGVKYTWYIFDSLDINLLPKRSKLGPTSSRDTFYLPSKLGQYGVSLVAVSTNGCRDSVNAPGFISVNHPRADFVMKKPIVCFGDPAVVTAKPTPAEAKFYSYKYNWVVTSELDPNFESKELGSTMSFNPVKLGKYTVSLTVKNGHCQGDTTKKSFFQVDGDLTSIRIADTVGCLNPDFRTIVSLGPENKYPNDPKNPPTYSWGIDDPNGKAFFVDPHAKSTQLVIKTPGCFKIFVDIMTKIGADSCKNTLIREGKYAICVGANLAYLNTRPGCKGDTMSYTAFTDTAIHSIKWVVSPKGYADILPNDTARNMKLVPKADTCYIVTLKGTKLINGMPCEGSYIDSFCIGLPDASFTTTTPTFYCAPGIGRFNVSGVKVKKYIWYFGDGDSLETETPGSITHVYSSFKTPTYTVKLVVIDSNGCSKTIIKKDIIKIIGPFPHFTVNKTQSCDSITVNFKNTSKNVNKFTFFYDDGTPADTVNLKPHTYAIQDPNLDSITYYPTLLSRDDAGCKVFYEDSIKIYQSAIDTRIVIDTNFGCTPLRVHFNSISKSANSWRWDLDGDGIIDATIANPSFLYKKPGKYPVTIIVENKGKCPLKVDSKDSITVVPNVTAKFIPSTKKICGRQEISFNNKSKNYKYLIFKYGDGTSNDSGVISKHSYFFDPAVNSGDSVIFYPKLIAFNASNCSDSTSDTLVAYRTPVAGFKSSVLSGCSPLKVSFTDTSKYGFGSEWDFDNNGVIDAYGKTVEHVFTPGLYTVKLRSFSIHGCVDSVVNINMIEVNEPPKAAFSISDSDICYNTLVNFKNLTFPFARVTKWLWNFNEPVLAPKDTSTLQEPTFAFLSKGFHTIRLTATDDKGCTGTFTKQVFVEDTLPPKTNGLLYVSVLDTHQVVISWKKNTIRLFNGYLVNRLDNGSPVVIYNATNETDTGFTYTDPSINTSSASYCFSVQVQNSCGLVSFGSNAHCTILLSGIAMAGPVNRLNWSSYRGWAPRSYLIYRSGNDGVVKLIDSVNGGVLTYADSNLCDEKYCYYVVALETGTNYSSTSNTVCLQALYVYQSALPVLRYVTDWNNNEIKLEWDPVPYKGLSNYIIEKQNIKTGWINSYATTPNTVFVDKDVDINSYSYNYKIRTIDKCGYFGPQSNNGSSILLNQSIHNDNVELRWNAYRTWQAGVKQYRVQVQLRNKTFKTIATLTDTSYTDDSVYNYIDTAYCYRVIAYENGAITDSSVSNRTCAVLPSRIFVPNAFSPGNGDSLNDVWKVSAVSIYNMVGSKLKNYSARVFNRWGTLMFETDDINKGWDGTFRGKPVPCDVYIYLLDAEGIDAKYLHLKGNVTVLK